jgi:hypothetical protein
MGLWDGFGRRVVDLTQAEGMPDSVIPTATGIPLREPVSVCRFTGEDTDRLVVADGLRLLVYAPS